MIPVENEMAWILEAYGERYGEKAHDIQTTFHFEAHQAITIDDGDVAFHLGKLRPRKAVPNGTAPAIVWKACHRELATPTAAQLQHMWNGQEWADADVLPKAHGRSNSPLDWRPIGVQTPLGKCVMSALIGQARQDIVNLIHRYPQCAYMPGRSTNTALRQVFDTNNIKGRPARRAAGVYNSV